MDWRFASEGRHGIDFSIVTRETWEGDADKDVVYDVSNIRVDSPSGAPDEFTERTAGFGSGGRIELRIGIPGSDSPMGVAAGVESFGSKVPSAASSSTLASSSVLADGGSGGSSGFSGDSSGGAGGGGTGSSSW